MRVFFLAALSATIAVLLAASGHAQQKHSSAPGTFGAGLAALPTEGWPTNGGNLYNQRYSPLTAINRGNVARLKGVWRARLRGSGTCTAVLGLRAAASCTTASHM